MLCLVLFQILTGTSKQTSVRQNALKITAGKRTKFESDLLKINENITLKKVYKRLHDGEGGWGVGVGGGGASPCSSLKNLSKDSRPCKVITSSLWTYHLKTSYVD